MAPDPYVYPAGTVPPAVQSIMTLNISSQKALDLLLAALLDNTTGGLNGTFEAVTSNLASLGLDAPVLAAISNVPVTSEGLYGPPTSNLPSQTSRSSGLWGNFWNAASAVVTTVTGAVVSLLETTWDATLATFTYFNDLARAASAFGGLVLARAAGTIVAIGNKVVADLDAVLDYVVTILKSALSPVISAVNSAVGNYYNPVSTSLNQTWAAVDEGHPVTALEGESFGSALSGPLLDDALGMGAVVEIALFVMLPFDIGPSVFISIAAGLLGAGVISGLGALSGAGAASFSTDAVSAVQTFVSDTRDPPSSVTNPVNWEVISGLVSVLSGLASLPVALGLCEEAFLPNPSTTSVLWAGPVALAMDVVAIALALYALTHPAIEPAVFALFISMVAFGATYFHFQTSPAAKSIPAFRMMAEIDLTMSIVGAFASGADLGLQLLT